MSYDWDANIMSGVSILGVLGASYYGYYYVKGVGQRYVNSQVMIQLNEKMEKEGEPFVMMGKNAALITFTHGGKQHHITTPYNRSNARSMNRKVVYLIDSEGNKTNITHKPGIPYTLSAKDMGGVGILVEKDNKMLSENGRYGLEDIPGYL